MVHACTHNSGNHIAWNNPENAERHINLFWITTAFDFSSSDILGNILQKSCKLMQDMLNDDANSESLSSHSLKKGRSLVQTWDRNREKPDRKLVYELTESLEVMTNWMAERENNRHRPSQEENEEDFSRETNAIYGMVNEEEFGRTRSNEDHEEEKSHDDITDDDISEDSDGIEEYNDDSCEESDSSFNGTTIEKTKTNMKTTKKLPKKKYECDICGKMLAEKWTLADHRATHIEPSKLPFKCEKCERKFPSIKSFRNHMLTHLDDDEAVTANELRPFKCEVCGNTFRKEKDLFHHRKTIHAAKQEKFECNFCSGSFKSKAKLEVHKRIHIEDEELRCPYKCDKCGKRFGQLCGLNCHIRTHFDVNDPRRQRPYQCDECGKGFRLASILKQHKLTHTLIRRRENCNELCGKIFKDIISKKDHMRKTHAADNRTECDRCGKELKFSSLKEHMKTHMDENDPEQAKQRRPHTCDQCGKSFVTSQSLRMHFDAIHADKNIEGRYKCGIYGLSFVNTGTFTRHKRKHLPDTDPRKKIKCDNCGKSYCADWIKKHIRSHSVDETVRKPFPCDLCDMRFAEKRKILLHKLSHSTNETVRRPFPCDLCGKRFRLPKDLQVHRESHSRPPRKHRTDGKFQCKLCPWTFNILASLRSHYKCKHPEAPGPTKDLRKTFWSESYRAKLKRIDDEKRNQRNDEESSGDDSKEEDGMSDDKSRSEEGEENLESGEEEECAFSMDNRE